MQKSQLLDKYCGVCLCAGLATRLRPLTDVVAKAEIPVFGISSLEYAISRLRFAGINDFAINTHHLAERATKLANSISSEIFISHEPVLLGSGGAFDGLRAWIGKRTVLMANPDVISDISLPELLHHHEKSGAMMTIAAKLENNGTVWLDDTSGEVLYLGKTSTKGTRAKGLGIFVFGSKFLNYIPTGIASDFIVAVNNAITDGQKISTYICDPYFRDFGDSVDSIYRLHYEIATLPQENLSEFHFADLQQRKIREFSIQIQNSIDGSSPSLLITAGSGFEWWLNEKKSVFPQR